MPSQSKTIYIIRHGETEYNKLGLVQGSGIDASLNEVGVAQADAFYQHFQHIPFKRVYTSKLKRTHESVTHFLEAGIPWEQYEGLNEISWGTSEGKITNPENDKVYYDTIRRWADGETDLIINGGESPLAVAERQKSVLQIIDSRDEEPILVCMHGRAMRIILCQLLNLPLQNMDLFEHRNLCLYKLQKLNGKWEIRVGNFVVHPPAGY
jgi:broad specificity phosphatase PhoE